MEGWKTVGVWNGRLGERGIGERIFFSIDLFGTAGMGEEQLMGLERV